MRDQTAWRWPAQIGSILLLATVCALFAPRAHALDKQIATISNVDGTVVATFTDRADDAALLAAIPELLAQGVQAVSLRGTPVHDMTPLERLVHLKSLDICGSLVRNVGPLASISGLKSINLQFLPVSDLTPLAGLADLESLNLGGTEVHDLTPLAKLAHLHELVLAVTKSPISARSRTCGR
jgi:Leucine-rich repeat (LRR) protein